MAVFICVMNTQANVRCYDFDDTVRKDGMTDLAFNA